MEATWPPARRWRTGPFTLRDGQGGGQRVSAATVESAFTPAELDSTIAAMPEPIFQIGAGAAARALDQALEARGWRINDPVVLYLAPVPVLAAEPPPRVSAFALWPPLAIMRDLWAEGGIGPARLAVMERVGGPKMALLARAGDRPAGVGFVALDDDIAMVHALHILPESRRQGAARNLMRAAAGWADRLGARWLALAVTRQNAAANGLYASLGMEIVEKYHYRIPPDAGQGG
ncbi:GNAT family N-acetyltransferase [Frigidibacter sp. ROC022]|uniref:GNAT family N-acetyltransferase n=1 Tax=Frigidibacter sp. ROC022 TaxID=2971796 RepID=UPI00215A9C31|nr:GNAT family N-acetyltransferase [Frigidibacter sp. ROC022]MCR8724854.1 GNAT family N-acetyltransferase [Frigidibacter sp. ROC022]